MNTGTPKQPLTAAAAINRPTAALMLESGEVYYGMGAGAQAIVGAEICFNTGMTGYQEILSDPSYAGQIVTFSFPHIGIVGTNEEDVEGCGGQPHAVAAVFRQLEHIPSNYRSTQRLSDWLAQRGIVGLYGIDTRSVVNRIRKGGMQRAVIAHQDPLPSKEQLQHTLNQTPIMEGQNLARNSAMPPVLWQQGTWSWSAGFAAKPDTDPTLSARGRRVTVLDFGTKSNILRSLAARGCVVQTLAGNTPYAEIIASQPEAIVLSSGPGDPAALGTEVLHTIRQLVNLGIPMLGVCLGHQLLALALGAKTKKMAQGHHGVNHPVLNVASGTVRITSMNHGFDVDVTTLPDNAEVTYRSLFDGSNAGIRLRDKPVLSVQFHPEASPGPLEGADIFDDFAATIGKYYAAPAAALT